MRVLMWHVHGSYSTAMVQGDHTYLTPVTPDRGPDGRGRAQTWDWPPNAVEVAPGDLRDADVDVVVLQRPEELSHLAADWLGGRRPGRDIPAVYLEHNAPQGRIDQMVHPAAGRRDLEVVHVTHFNQLFWDCGSTPTRVVEHGVVDPGLRFTGELPAVGAVVNEPARRGRVTGTDLLPQLAEAVTIDLFGMGTDMVQASGIRPQGDIPQDRMHTQLGRRRAYLHPFRWTSLGLALIEAMMLGLPVVALATTEVVTAVPADAGVIATDPAVLRDALARFVEDPDDARATGLRAREAALARFGVDRFLADWDAVLHDAVDRFSPPRRTPARSSA